MTTTAEATAVTVPELAGRLGVSLWTLTGLIDRRPDLAHLIFRAGGRRMTAASNVTLFRSAFAEQHTAQPTMA